MKQIKKIFNYLVNKNYRIIVNSNLGFYKHMDDKRFICKKYEACFGKKLNLDNPITYNEKLQWLKLYNRKDIYTTMVDKCEAKKYVGEKIGFEHIIPQYGVWENFDDIDFDSLPNEFVLKCTHDCGGLIIVKDKSKFDKKAAKRIINKSLKTNYYIYSREWPYKNVRPRIIAEKYMEDNDTKELRDYKLFAFDGEVKSLFVASDRQNPFEETKFDFFDSNFNHLELEQGHKNSRKTIKPPKKLNEMIAFAEILSKGIPHVRCDFYEVNGEVYFGEMTFYHYGGFVPFNPSKWDEEFGNWIKLPEIKI